MNKTQAIYDLVEGDGYVVLNNHFKSSTISYLSSAITSSICNLFNISASKCSSLSEASKLHLDDQLKDRWPNLNVFDRTLNKEYSEQLACLPELTELGDYFDYKIVDSYHNGYPAFTWRITRPNAPGDFRPIHKDAWFRYAYKSENIINSDLPPQLQTVKVWIAMAVTCGKSGLLVVPESQKNIDYPRFQIKEVDNLTKPVINEKQLNSILPILAPITNNSLIIFGEQLIHGGAPNKSDQCRISLEFTLGPKNYIPAFKR